MPQSRWLIDQPRAFARLALFALAAALPAAPAAAQFATGFEAPTYTGSAAGVPITGQDGWTLAPVAGSIDGLVMTYAGNAFGLPANPAGGEQFLGERSNGGTAFPRAERLGITLPNVVTIYYDVCARYNGVLPAIQNLGSFSLQPLPVPATPATKAYIQLNTWVNLATADTWNAGYLIYDSAGAFTGVSVFAGPAWQNLAINHWYRLCTTIDFVQNRIIGVSIIDLDTCARADAQPVGWFLGGGANSTLPVPTGCRFFAGGTTAGNIQGWDNLDIAAPRPPLTIVNVDPPEAAEGQLVRIRGTGFGNNPDNLCAVVMHPNGADAVPMRVLQANDQEIVAEMRAVPPDFPPGQIMVGLGQGNRGTFRPAFFDVFVEDPQGTWVWNRNCGEAATFAAAPFRPIPVPPPPPITWFFGQVQNGRLCVIIDGNWMPNTYIRVMARAHNHAMQMGADLEAFCIRIRLGGSTEHCAARICDVIRCAFLQRGIIVNCRIDPVPGTTAWKITVTKKGPNGQPVPIDWGCFNVCVQMPHKFHLPPPALFAVTPFFNADIVPVMMDPGPVRAFNIGSSGEDGVSIGQFRCPDPGGVQIDTELIQLSLIGSGFSVAGWGSVGGMIDMPLGRAGVQRNVDSFFDVFADFSDIGASMVRAQVYMGDMLVGETTLPQGDVGRILQDAAGRLPGIIGCGKLPPNPPCFLIDWQFPTIFRPADGTPPLMGDQLRLLAADAPQPIDFIQMLDLRGAMLNNNTFVIRNGQCLRPPCPCDFNNDGVLNSQDFFDFLACFFTPGCPNADFNGDGVANSQDFFDFLACFFAGCP